MVALMGPKVKVLRLDERSGLIKARMAGAAYSTGEVCGGVAGGRGVGGGCERGMRGIVCERCVRGV